MSEPGIGDGPSPMEESFVKEQFPNANWHLVPFEQMQREPLTLFEVITDIPNIPQCNTVEETICKAILRPFPSSRFAPGQREAGIISDRISNHLRPRKFNGSLLNAKAIIVPLDPERAVSLHHRLKSRPSYLNDRPLEDITHGLSVIYSGDLRSSRAGVIGSVLQEANYFFLRPEDESKYNQTGHLLRSLGPNMQVGEVSRIVDQETLAAQEVAEKTARFALKHVYSGGTSGLGKRS